MDLRRVSPRGDAFAFKTMCLLRGRVRVMRSQMCQIGGNDLAGLVAYVPDRG